MTRNIRRSSKKQRKLQKKKREQRRRTQEPHCVRFKIAGAPNQTRARSSADNPREKRIENKNPTGTQERKVPNVRRLAAPDSALHGASAFSLLPFSLSSLLSSFSGATKCLRNVQEERSAVCLHREEREREHGGGYLREKPAGRSRTNGRKLGTCMATWCNLEIASAL